MGMADVHPTAPARILVVDDDVHMALIVSRMLERSGHQCRCAHSVAEALHSLSDQAVELIISDLNMPGGSGLELVARARDADLDLAIVILSGVDDPATAREAIALGAFG